MARTSRPLALLLLPLALGLPAGCCSLETTPRDWEEVGLYRTPRQAFRTFQVALAKDVPVLGHRSFSLRFMRDHQLSGLAWRLVVEQLRREMPFFRCIGEARVLEEQELAPDRRRLIAEVQVLFSRTRFHVDLVREDYWEAWDGDVRLSDDAADWGALVAGEPAEERVLLTLPTYGEYRAEDVTEFRVGREWKIDGFGRLDPD